MSDFCWPASPGNLPTPGPAGDSIYFTQSTQRGEESLLTLGLNQPRQRRPHWEVRTLQNQALGMRDRLWAEQEMQPLRGCAEVGTLEHAQDLASTFSGSQSSVMPLNGLMTELAF